MNEKRELELYQIIQQMNDSLRSIRALNDTMLTALDRAVKALENLEPKTKRLKNDKSKDS